MSLDSLTLTVATETTVKQQMLIITRLDIKAYLALLVGLWSTTCSQLPSFYMCQLLLNLLTCLRDTDIEPADLLA
jgi:hypothetical protein